MSNFLEKYSRIIFIILAVCCIIIAYLKNQIFLYPAGVILLLLGIGILKIDNDREIAKKEEEIDKEKVDKE